MALLFQESVILAPYTIYKIGGPARFFVAVKGGEELKEAVAYATGKNAPFFILGAGSNVLGADEGFDGPVIHMTGGAIKVNGERVVADAGVMMAQAVLKSASAGLTGFEWGIGIPGTIGGSVRGNAGGFGGEMKDIVASIDVFDASNDIRCTLPVTNCEFNYRNSIFKKHPEWIILSATLKLAKGDSDKIREAVRRIIMARTEKQDIGTKSCGCIFKNVSWNTAGAKKEELLAQFPELAAFKGAPHIPASFLIDRAGLKGKKVGHVFISPRHANFFVNEGGALAADVRALIQIAKDAVREKFGLLLQEEIEYLGFAKI